MNHRRLYRRGAVAAICLLLAGLLPTSVLSAANPRPAAGAIASPLVLYTDITSGPISGGENNKGIYLSIFGKGFGASAGMGVSTRVYIGGAEVDNYRYLGPSKVSGASGIQQITVQVGSLGTPTLGAALPIDVKVNGVDSNTDTAFTPNPGKIYFVSNVSGNDATGVANDIAHPYRHVQLPVTNNNGVNGCPVSAGDQAVSTSGVWGIVHPGDFIVMRGGTWTDLGRDDFFLRTQNKSGTAPTGASGSGPISVIGYPAEDVFINLDHNANPLVEGGISSADSARQELGCGSWVTVANLRLESGGREGMLTTQAGSANPAGSHWRVVNNELTAASVDPNSAAKGAGVSGSGDGELYYGNYIHDVHGGTPEHENHGFYIDGSGSYDIAYNWLKNISGGNGINVYGSSGTAPDNIKFHHNVIDGVGKHGLNIADGATHDLSFYDNLLYNIANYCVRFNTNSLSGSGVKVWNNTFAGCGAVRDDFGYNALVANTWNDVSPSLSSMYNNIFVSSTSGPAYFGGADIGAVDSNLYFGSSDTTTYSSDPHAVVSNPQFTSTTPGAENFALQASSQAVNAGTALVSSLLQSTRDLSLDVIRPQGSSYDIGAYEFSDSVTPLGGATYHAITPTRILDTRYGTGGLSGALPNHVARPFQVTGRAVSSELPGGIPSSATAITGNLTVTGQNGLGYLFLGPVGMNNPTSSTLNFPVGDDRANAVTVALSPAGQLSVTYASPVAGTTAHAILDITGFFTPDTSGATYTDLTPTRILDSRDGTGGLSGAFVSHVARTFNVFGHGGVPGNATAVTGNLTVTGQNNLGYLSIGPVAQDNPSSSTLNFPVGDDRANAVTVALSAGGTLSITYAAPVAGKTAHVIFDVTGYFTPDLTGAKYVQLTPTRILDTRYGTGGLSPLDSHHAQTFTVIGHGGVPSNAVAVTGNLTVTGQNYLGYLFIGPVAQDNPTSSTLNFPLGDDRANAVTVGLSPSGTLSVTYAAPVLGKTAHAVFDVTGYFVI